MSLQRDSAGKVLVFTDGCSLQNGRKNCRAGWAVYFGPDHPFNTKGEIYANPSNQHAELYAIYKALLNANKLHQVDKGLQFVIVTDSQYSIDCLTKWAFGWKKNGFKTKRGDPVKHSKLIKDALELICSLPVSFRHVPSHRGPPSREAVDLYAYWLGNHTVDKMARDALLDKRMPTGPELAVPL